MAALMYRWQVRYRFINTNINWKPGETFHYLDYTDLNEAYGACDGGNRSWSTTYFFWTEEIK